MIGLERDQMRRTYMDSWQKAKNGQPLEGHERMIAEVVSIHPEYHRLLEAGEAGVAAEFTPEQGESNPYLHMGLHLALREQLATNRPEGILEIYQRLLKREDNTHKVEHLMQECLAELMWQQMQQNRTADEKDYLSCLQRL